MINYASGFRWGLLFNIATKVVALVAGLILARWLGPTVMNAYWLILTFFVFADLFREFGLLTAYLNDPDIVPHREAWYQRVAIAAGIIVGLLVAAAGFPLADYFGVPELQTGCLFLGGILTINGCSTIATAKLLKQGRFKETGLIETIAFFVSYAVALLLVAFGVRFEALMIQLLLCACITLVLVWRAAGVDGKTGGEPMDRSILKRGASIAAGNVLWLSYSSIDQPLVSKVFGVSIGGNYGIAKQLTAKPGDFLGVPLMRTIQVAVGHRAGDIPSLRRALSKAILVFCFVLGPMFLCLTVLAAPFIEALLGPEYASAPALVAPLSAYAFFKLFGAVPGNVAVALGKAHVITVCWLIGFVATALYAFFRAGSWNAVEIGWTFAVGFLLVNGLVLLYDWSQVGVEQKMIVMLAKAILPVAGVTGAAMALEAWGLEPWPTVILAVVGLPLVYAALLGTFLAGTPSTFFSKMRTRALWESL